jgi:hypothetical protein
MTTLKPEYAKVIATILREYGKTVDELHVAKVMIKFCSENKKSPPVQWEYALEETLKKLPATSAPSQVFELAALRLEQHAYDTDLIELLSKLPKGKPPN